MIKIKPFRALRYDPLIITDLAGVLAPPYDVISPQQQEALYARSPFNIVRLILNHDKDCYASASRSFQQWKNDQVLKLDPEPAIYLVQQEYTMDGRKHMRTGFVATAQIQDFSEGNIKPHERTLAGPKADRLKLMQACNCNFSQIFILYPDPEKVMRPILENVTLSKPLNEAETDDGVIQRMWLVPDPAQIAVIQACMANKELFIADGHHRYETAVNYRNEIKAKLGSDWNPEHPANYVMMMFIEMSDPGLLIFPTHRIVHSLDKFSFSDLQTKLAANFAIENCANAQELKAILDSKINTTGVFGVIDKNNILFIEPLPKSDLSSYFPPETPEALKSLDVSILHQVILEGILAIDREKLANKTNLDYIKDFQKTFDAITAGEGQVAFLMNPTKIEQVEAVSRTGEVMPQKSTYFYPKLISGLVINPLDG